MKNIKRFIERWQGHGDEKGETQTFWISLLRDVLGLENPDEFLIFEKRVELEHVSFIDVYIPSTRVIIEQKSIDVSLTKAAQQSDGTYQTPFEQAKRYSDWLPASQRADWIITCNFQEFQIHDMEKPKAEPEIIKLTDLESQWPKLQFLIDVNAAKPKDIQEAEISVKAGELVGKLYEALKSRYKNPDSEASLRSLNILCVRIVFLLFAEDVGIFNKRQFHDYLFAHKDSSRLALIALFTVLSQKLEDRDPYTASDLMNFPYVNGGLFNEQFIEIPLLDGEPLDIILHDMSDGFDWSNINPPIFGAIFESTLNRETRKQGGMHYTTLKNIHKVIDPLFLDKLKTDVDELLQRNPSQTELKNFRKKLSTYKFFDPACGSGNFLTETYLSLCRLEMKIIATLNEIPFHSVNINQFYGIEINDFAGAVAKTALWIADIQMSKEVNAIEDLPRKCLPLENYNNIREGNALTMDWHEIVKPAENLFILGNPPFIGQSVRTEKQSKDMSNIWGKGEIETKLDYVICWYKKAIDYINSASDKHIKAAFVSTNSICQGESVPTFWQKMISLGTVIDFAYKPFVWNSEASDKAAVHCVIVGFSNFNNRNREAKILFNGNDSVTVKHINPYLYNAPDIWISNRINKPQNDLPKMTTGSPPTDDGALTMTAEEKLQLEEKYPALAKYLRPFIGAREFLHDKVGTFSRYCLWFKDGNPSDYVNIPEIKERLKRVKAIREKSSADRIQKMADYPYLFCQIRQPGSTYLVVPRHSSENRRYIPIGFMAPEIIAGDACSIIPNISSYEFAILTSSVHMAWVRVVCGRIKSDFRYSPSVYNNFTWPIASEKQKAKIEKTAQGILEARALYPESSLADLYDAMTMPVELLKAHKANDMAVLEAYGFPRDITEEEIVARLMNMYEKLTKKGNS